MPKKTDKPHVRQGIQMELAAKVWDQWVEDIPLKVRKGVDVKFILLVKEGTFVTGLDQLGVMNRFELLKSKPDDPKVNHEPTRTKP